MAIRRWPQTFNALSACAVAASFAPWPASVARCVVTLQLGSRATAIPLPSSHQVKVAFRTEQSLSERFSGASAHHGVAPGDATGHSRVVRSAGGLYAYAVRTRAGCTQRMLLHACRRSNSHLASCCSPCVGLAILYPGFPEPTPGVQRSELGAGPHASRRRGVPPPARTLANVQRGKRGGAQRPCRTNVAHAV